MERFQKLDPELSATGYNTEVDDVIKIVTWQILHLPPRCHRSQRRARHLIHGAEGVNINFVFYSFSSGAFEIRQVHLFRAMYKN
jgi:hypothetical protein